MTPSPSIDATLRLDSSLKVGSVNRAIDVTRVAGGKGVNVSHAIHAAGSETVAIFPAADTDPFIQLARQSDFPFVNVPMGAAVRTNTTLTDPDGFTTKANGPGPVLSAEDQQAIIDQLSQASRTADYVVLAGSLPGGVDEAWYATLIQVVHAANPRAKVALDTSDKNLKALYRTLDRAMPDLIKPNGMELGQLVGEDGDYLEELARYGDYREVARAARNVNAWGISEVLVTLGAAGAILVTHTGAWVAKPPEIEIRSTVGAGDSALAGFILAREQGKDYLESLRTAVAYGTAAAGLPGTSVPRPEHIDLEGTKVTEL
ncbi:1-phosphofructokinase family hexose kinase [Corynebacterium phocae]|uniref:1-phosphofructokinase family hexose kinase n=1 Tax=Corynebacterium phocae TaxID=161895 RepID=UPI0031831358